MFPYKVVVLSTLVVAKLAAHAHRKLSAVVQKSFARRSFLLMQYATCTANRPTSIGSSSSNGLTAHSSTGKSLSEVLLFAEHGENMLCT